MKGRSHIEAGMVAAILILAGIFLMLRSRQAVDWNSRYEIEDEHPYGLSFIYALLDKSGGVGAEVVTDPFDKVYAGLDSSESYLYVNIGFERDYDSSETEALLKFVSRGNTVFSAVEDIDGGLAGILLAGDCGRPVENAPAKYQEEEAVIWDTVTAYMDKGGDTDLVLETEPAASGFLYGGYTDQHYSSHLRANLVDEKFCSDSGYLFYHYYRSDTVERYWTYFDGGCLGGGVNDHEILGHAFSGGVNFIGIPYGRGEFYLHTNPELFTNVELLDRSGLEYAENVFSPIPADRVLWDSYALPPDRNWDLNERGSSNPLGYILSELPLRRALYLILAMTVLYIAFRAKRRQQYIPLTGMNTNTSLEFIEMIGQLYYEQKDHRYISNQLWRQFIDHIRTHYFHGPVELKDDWAERLASRSGVDANLIKGIELAHEKADRVACEEDDLINLYNKLRYFYSNSK